MRVRPVYIKNKFKNLWAVWAMWAIKNFVHGPSAAVALWPGPSPGALSQKANCHGALCLQSLQCSTLVGGNVGIAYITYMVMAWGFYHAPGRPDVGNVGNVGNVFGEVESLAKRWGLAAKASHIIQPHNHKDIFLKH